MKIAVIGTGYLGATHAACMAEMGFEVVGLDTDPAKISDLAAGRLPFFEPELPELLGKHTASGRLRFTTDPEEIVDAEAYFLCVGTPQRTDGPAADTRFLFAALDVIVPRLRNHALVIGKSTVPVGTAAALQEHARTLAPDGVTVEIAWNPEFLREGRAVSDTLRPDRLVFGVSSQAAAERLGELYRAPLERGIPLVVTDLASAELVKVAANGFLATKISFVNAIAEMCDAAGADVVDVAEALGHDARIGKSFLGAGLGFGGGCLPKDIRALMARAGELGVDRALTFMREVDAINMHRRQRVVEMASEELDGVLLGRHVAVLGAAFKPETDDVRDSPALSVAAQLHLRGARVAVHDPVAIPNARKEYPTLNYADTVEEAADGADLLLHLTEWAQFRQIDPLPLADLVRDAVLIDARHALDAERWHAAGWTVRTMGRPRLQGGSAVPPARVISARAESR